MRVHNCIVDLNPYIPSEWKSYSFHARSGDSLFEVLVVRGHMSVINHSGQVLKMKIYGKKYDVEAAGKLDLAMPRKS
ncbi:MAG: hypothetical protein MZV63_70190 [Marinilabiliales bacterium]|nr:hypothetical protein [Marinilabiliales bacterium]